VHVPHPRVEGAPENAQLLSIQVKQHMRLASRSGWRSAYSKTAAAHQHKPTATTTAVQFGAIARPLGSGGRSTGMAHPWLGVGASLEVWLYFHRLDLCLTNDALRCT
jgi:hypothetical protein